MPPECPEYGVRRQGNLDWERDQSGSDIVGTCKGTQDMQEGGSCTAVHIADRRNIERA